MNCTYLNTPSLKVLNPLISFSRTSLVPSMVWFSSTTTWSVSSYPSFKVSPNPCKFSCAMVLVVLFCFCCLRTKGWAAERLKHGFGASNATHLNLTALHLEPKICTVRETSASFKRVARNPLANFSPCPKLLQSCCNLCIFAEQTPDTVSLDSCLPFGHQFWKRFKFYTAGSHILTSLAGGDFTNFNSLDSTGTRLQWSISPAAFLHQQQLL